MAVGEPQGLAWTATFGRVSAVRPGSDVEHPAVNTVVQFDAPINPGNSGGRLVTSDGRVIGLVTFGRSGSKASASQSAATRCGPRADLDRVRVVL